MQKFHNLRCQKASALLSSLFIMTLVAIAATAMSLRIQLDIYRTQLIVTTDKLYLASQGVVFWAMDTLSDPKNTLDTLGKQNQVAHFPDVLAKMYPGMTIEGGIYDLQARFNLNALEKKPNPTIFQNLLGQIFPNKSAKEKLGLTYAIIDWISTYDPGKGKDAYLSFYLRQKPAWQTSHQPMKSASELRLVLGINAAEYLALSPFVTVLPEAVPINIRTASKQVLFALSDKITETQVKDLIQGRKEQDYEKKARSIMSALQINANQVTFKSNYFLAVAIVTDGELKLINYSILKRQSGDMENKQVIVSLISENLNAL